MNNARFNKCSVLSIVGTLVGNIWERSQCAVSRQGVRQNAVMHIAGRRSGYCT